MARYIKDLPTQLPYAQAGQIINEFLMAEGFQYVSEKGEPVWRKGVGTVTVPQFVKALPGDGIVHIEAWLSGFAFLPGLYTGEMGLTGFWGWAMKAALRKRIEELERRLVSAVPVGMAPAPSAPPMAPPA